MKGVLSVWPRLSHQVQTQGQVEVSFRLGANLPTLLQPLMQLKPTFFLLPSITAQNN